jgi:hypothetical protein
MGEALREAAWAAFRLDIDNHGSYKRRFCTLTSVEHDSYSTPNTSLVRPGQMLYVVPGAMMRSGAGDSGARLGGTGRRAHPVFSAVIPAS